MSSIFDGNLFPEGVSNTNANDIAKYSAVLIEKALAGEHSKFELLKSFSEYEAAKILKPAVKKLVKAFKVSADRSFMAYTAKLTGSFKAGAYNTDFIQDLINHVTFKTCAEFYQKELDILKDEMSEFRVYAYHTGNFINLAVKGQTRPEEHMTDARKAPTESIWSFLSSWIQR